jgi:hypothetical protein
VLTCSPALARADKPVEQGGEGAGQGKAVGVALGARGEVLAAAHGIGLLQLDFIEITVKRALRHAIALAQ